VTDDVICGVKRKELKAVKRIQEKIMRAKSRLHWSQYKIFLVGHEKAPQMHLASINFVSFRLLQEFIMQCIGKGRLVRHGLRPTAQSVSGVS